MESLSVCVGTPAAGSKVCGPTCIACGKQSLWDYLHSECLRTWRKVKHTLSDDLHQHACASEVKFVG